MAGRWSWELPPWWEPSLYNFLRRLPLEGWVWEFYRRAVLKENLGGLPVEAMNPEPDFEKPLSEMAVPIEKDGWVLSNIEDEDMEPEVVQLASENWDLYYHWGHEEWKRKKPISLAPSVLCDDVQQLSPWFGRRYSVRRKLIGKTWLQKSFSAAWVDMRVDTGRFDAAIMRDFKAVLTELRSTYRKKYPRPKRVAPAPEKWKKNCILQVWDLREFNVPWQAIYELLLKTRARHREDKRRPGRIAYDTAVKYIEKGEWENLARYVDMK